MQRYCQKLQITQNKVIRSVLNIVPRSHLGPDEFRSLGWLPVSKRVDQIVLNHVFKINSRTSPDYMTEHFVLTSVVHSYGTRFKENGYFSLSKVKGFGKKTFASQGCKLWNDLPTNIKSIAHNQSFKVAVKAHFSKLALNHMFLIVAIHRSHIFILILILRTVG